MVYTLNCESTRRLILQILHIISCEITLTPLVTRTGFLLIVLSRGPGPVYCHHLPPAGGNSQWLRCFQLQFQVHTIYLNGRMGN